MGGDKDDRDGASLGLQMILKIKAIHPGQVDVENKARSLTEVSCGGGFSFFNLKTGLTGIARLSRL